MTIYRDVAPRLDLPRLERGVLRFWGETGAFQQRVALNRGGRRWSFIDGPITANNPMGVHHAWGRTYKDLYQRFKAMQGFALRYQNGFDCQGLWVEVEVEKALGLTRKTDIEAYGVGRFINQCKARVLEFAAIQVEQSRRLGYWMAWDDVAILRRLRRHMDQPEEILTVQGAEGSVTASVEQLVGRLGTPTMGGSYFTFSNENNYTIWGVLKACHQRGWLYKGRDVMPWCPRCSTALSQHEIATEGYRELTHPGVTLRFPLRGQEDAALLVWTTTPWTLTANMAVAVHPDLPYVRVQWKGENLYLGAESVDRVFPETPEIQETVTGRAMAGWAYMGPFDELPAEQAVRAEEAHRVILWDEVSAAEGTGIVHIAPGCGREDFVLGQQHHLPAVAPLDEYGVFRDGFAWLTGRHVYDSAAPIIEHLRGKGLLFRVEAYAHRYPVCWRCGNELVFRLVDEWFIAMGKKLAEPLEALDRAEVDANLRYQIMEATKQVRWIPPHGLHQELDWLQHMDDWMISKKRYWGLALPIWECPACGGFDVIGGEEELKRRAVVGWAAFEGHTPHRPWIDAVKIRCSHCGALMSRIKDVGNPWLDAGIVAYSTLAYRHDREYWRRWFPADLICESLPGQFRNWFYSMLTMSTILEQRPPFLTCVGHGSVLAEDGREMHKSWGNAIWFDDAVEKMGAEAMRWMYCSNKAETNLIFGYAGAETVKKRFLIPLWNIYSFFVTYANLDQWTPADAAETFSQLDRWMRSKLQHLIRDVTDALNAYDAYAATIAFQQFVDELSTWYIRRSRRRFWKSVSDDDKKAAYTTLYTCLRTLITLLAPFLPFLTEDIYQNLVRSVDADAPMSVHHNAWPKATPALVDDALMAAMDVVIHASRLGRAARNQAGIKLRQPLAEARIVGDEAMVTQLRPLLPLVADELNVKTVSLSCQEDDLVEYQLRLQPQILGKKYGALFPKLQASTARQDANALAASLRSGVGVEVEVDGRTVTLLPDEVQVEAVAKAGWVVAEEQGLRVGVNIVVDEALKREGLARDIVRRIQNQRKNAGFRIADEIETYYAVGPTLAEVFAAHGAYIAVETLSTALHQGEPPEEAYVETFDLAGEELRIGLVRAEVEKETPVDADTAGKKHHVRSP
jgi:isoleucyl-tRNA synthetase